MGIPDYIFLSSIGLNGNTMSHGFYQVPNGLSNFDPPLLADHLNLSNRNRLQPYRAHRGYERDTFSRRSVLQVHRKWAPTIAYVKEGQFRRAHGRKEPMSTRSEAAFTHEELFAIVWTSPNQG